ncbi:MAG: exodeoxyribonuclease VII small subunit [Ruminococcaceae bacterium]|nr:exodeoxyribonuclease VII small subunit [Oscillospiraceae bacterium]
MSDKDLSFENAYAKLEEIAQKLNSNDISLDQAIALYEEGMKLTKFCTETLENAKQRIEVLKSVKN